MITLPHAIFIYDEAGNPVPVISGSTLNSGSRGFVIYAKDGSNQARNFVVDASGNLAIQNPSNLDVTLSSRFNTLGQKVMTGSTPVVIATDQTVIPVSDNNNSLTIDNAFIDANISTLATTANQTNGNQKTQIVSSSNILNINSSGQAAIQNPSNLDVALSTRLSQATFTSSVGEVQTTPTANTVLGRLKDINDTANTLVTQTNFNSRVNTLGQKVMTDSTPVVIASNQSEFPVVQGTAAVLSGAWPVKITDGTNVQPTGDVQTRAVFNYITDGVNGVVSVKTGSTSAVAADRALVTALSPNTQLPSGSNTLGYVMQGLSASLGGAWPVKITDGTNVQPTMDSQTRAGFVRLTDGVNSVVTVRTGSSISQATDNSLIVQISPNQQPIPTQVVPQTSTPGSSVGKVSISANTLTAVRATAFVIQTTNAQRSFVSTNANDSSAGTGARQIKLTYLNASAVGPFTETITLNGLTAVNTVATDICFIESVEVISVGSNGSNVGTINMYSTTGGTGTIIAAVGINNIISGIGDNQTLYCHHFVPSGSFAKIYYINAGSAIGGTATAQALIRSRNPTAATSPEVLVSDITANAQGNSANRTYTVPIDITGPAFLTGYMIVSNNGTSFLSFDWSEQIIG